MYTGLTKEGEKYLANRVANELPVVFTKVKIGNGHLAGGVNPAESTQLISFKKEIEILEKVQNDNIARLRVLIENSDIESGFFMKELGVYVQDEIGREILYWYVYEDNGQFVYSKDERAIQFDLELLMEVSSNDSTILNWSGEGTWISKKYFDEKVRTFQIANVEEMIKRKNLKVGDIVELLGYYTAGDGAGHKRVIADSDDGSGVQLGNGLWANIYEERIHPSYFGIDKNNIDLALLRKFVSYNKEKFLFDTKITLKEIGGKWVSGLKYPITFYGDSTTDGNNTTYWSPNPTNPVGSINHTETGAPNAYCRVLQDTVRDITGNSTATVYNAGYSGQSLANEWTLNNIEKAIFSNTYYSDTEVVCIGFGLNDITYIKDNQVLMKKYLSELECNVVYCFLKGTQPILIKSTPAYDLNGRDTDRMVLYIESCIDTIAEKYNLEIIDLRSEIQYWLNTNLTGDNWSNIVSDAIHLNDKGHRMVASYLVSKLFGNVLTVDEDRIISYQDPEFVLYYENPPISTYAQPRDGKSIYGKFDLGTSGRKLFSRILIYNNNPNINIIYNDNLDQGKRGENLTTDYLPQIKINSLLEKKEFSKFSIKNKVQFEDGMWNVPVELKELDYGLSIIEIYLPTKKDSTTSAIAIGYFEIFENKNRNYLGEYKIDDSDQVQLYKNKIIKFNKVITSSKKSYHNGRSCVYRDNQTFYDLYFGQKMRFKFSMNNYSRTGFLFNLNNVYRYPELDGADGLFFESGNKIFFFRVSRNMFNTEPVQYEITATPSANDELLLEVEQVGETLAQKITLYNLTTQTQLMTATTPTSNLMCSGSGVGVWASSPLDNLTLNYAEVEIVSNTDVIELNPSVAMNNVIEKLSDPVMLYAMEQEGDTTKQDFLEFSLEKMKYDNQLEEEEKEKQEAYQLLLQDNPNLTWEKFKTQYSPIMSLEEKLKEPVIPQSVQDFMKKYL